MKLPEPIDSLIKKYLPQTYVVHSAEKARGVDGRVVTYADRHAAITGQYNMLSANVRALSPENPIKTILITSSQHREGKTITSCNLAFSMSLDKEKKTLLVDANLRAPMVHSMFGLAREPGFSDLLSGRAAVERFTAAPAIGDLYIIPAGDVAYNPTVLLSPADVEKMVRRLKSEFDCVIFDTPSVHEYSDAGVIGSLCDAVFLVVKARSTQEDIIEEAFNRLTEAHARPRGCILTNAKDVAKLQHPSSKYKHLYLTPGK